MAKTKSSSKSKASSSSKTFETPFSKTAFANGNNGFEAAAKTFESLFNSKNMEEATSLGKDNLDAVLEASNSWAQGCQELTSAWMGFAQQSLESGVTAAKELMDCKNLQEAIDLQTNYTRSLVEEAVNEGTRLSELSLRVANQAFEPVRDRLTTTMEKAFKAA